MIAHANPRLVASLKSFVDAFIQKCAPLYKSDPIRIGIDTGLNRIGRAPASAGTARFVVFYGLIGFAHLLAVDSP